jgi:thiol-disulfide isomerase/thioredoxin
VIGRLTLLGSVCLLVAAPFRAVAQAAASPAGSWRAVLDLAGGPLRFAITIERTREGFHGQLCNGSLCDRLTGVGLRGDSVVLEMADYDASITARIGRDSLVGYYFNVGSRGPRTIPFRAARGRWRAEPPHQWLVGRWDAWFVTEGRRSPRVFEFRRAATGLEGTIVSNNGDYGLFWGRAEADSLSMSHFDGSFVYMLTGRLDGDTLRGIFHAGLRTQTSFVAVRSTGARHLTPPTEVISADTLERFRFSFRDLDGRTVTEADERFQGKIVIVNILGTWCPTCHDSEPALVDLYNRYRSRGLEMVGLAYEVTGDTAVDAVLVRRYRDKFGISFPLLLAGTSDAAAAEATQPQLSGPIAFPTIIFLDRRGRVRRVHAGFYGPATGEQHRRLVAELERELIRLLGEPAPD